MLSPTRSWQEVESDPEVFTQLVMELGIKGAQVEELWSLDRESLKRFGSNDVYGLIFLFKWREFEGERRTPLETWPPELYFANQVIENACATQAILSIVMNRPEIDAGPTIQEFKDFTRDFTPTLKGLAMTNCEKMRLAHNSFVTQVFDVEEEEDESRGDQKVADAGEASKRVKRRKVEDSEGYGTAAYHFISYVPVNNRLYELDGLKRGPFDLGPCASENWLEDCIPFVQKRMQWFSNEEASFNCMAVVKERLPIWREQLRKAKEDQDIVANRIRAALRQSADKRTFKKVVRDADWRQYSAEVGLLREGQAV